jgi:hypothetical protein
MKKNYTEKEASYIYGPSVAWFRRKRWEGDGPQFIKLTGMVLYPVDELESYFSSRIRKSTSDPGPTAKTAQTGNQKAKVRQIGKKKETAPAGLSPIAGQGGVEQ